MFGANLETIKSKNLFISEKLATGNIFLTFVAVPDWTFTQEYVLGVWLKYMLLLP